MPVERTPKGAPSANRQKTPARQGGSGGGQRQSRGRGGGAGKRGGGGASKRGGAQRLEEYEPPSYPDAQSLYFRTSADWHDLDATLARPGVRCVTFGPDFPITNEHLQLIGSHPQLSRSLEMLSLGDEDTGNGTWLTDDAILRLVPATPNLRVLRLSSCTELTDTALVNAIEHCPRLESLRISAHDKTTGKITQKGLKALRERPEIGNALKEIVLLSQPVSLINGEKEAKALSKAKKGLAITLGICPGRYDDDGAPDPVFFNGKMHFFGMPV